MKACVILLALLSSVFAHQATFEEIAQQWRNVIMSPYISECLCDSKGNPGIMERFVRYWEMPDDPCFKCNLRCHQIKTGMITPLGALNVEVYREKVAGITDDIVNYCVHQYEQGDVVDQCQKSYDLTYCSISSINSTLSVPQPSVLYD